MTDTTPHPDTTPPVNTPKHTALAAEHRALDAVFTDFGGWNMPLRYGSELAEHTAVRQTAALFDLSHMGEIWIEGADAPTFLNQVLVGDLAGIAVGRAKYSLLCTEDGGIIDDVICYRTAAHQYLMVPNAGNTETVLHTLQQRATHSDVTLRDASAETSLIAVQGPESLAILNEIFLPAQQDMLRAMKYYSVAQIALQLSDPAAEQATGTAASVPVLIARTGYTGEDGYELFLDHASAAALWRALLAAGTSHGLIAAGLAARDSLRLEAGMPLYGNELSRAVTPFDTGLGAVVSFTKPEAFVGRDALEAARSQPRDRVLVGLRGTGRRAARCGYAVRADADNTENGEAVGVVTSGLLSPTLGYPIALASVHPDWAQPGTEVHVDLRGTAAPFTVVELPFYSRHSR